MGAGSTEDDTCLSTQLVTVEQWQAVREVKKNILERSGDTLCADKLCNGTCGPVYFYVTKYPVFYGTTTKRDFSKVAQTLQNLTTIQTGSLFEETVILE